MFSIIAIYKLHDMWFKSSIKRAGYLPRPLVYMQHGDREGKRDSVNLKEAHQNIFR
jgi:hypothetical protein